MTTPTLREGDRITYRYVTDTPGKFHTSDPLTVKDGSLYDPKHGFYITYYSNGDLEQVVDGIENVTVVEHDPEPLASRIAELEAALEAEREERKREMLDYKEQVKATARAVGEEQGWCIQGQNEVLAHLDIETRVKSRVSVALEFDMVAFTDNEDPTRSFAQDSLVEYMSMGEVVAALRELIDLDSDWEDVVFDESSINFRVTGVEEEQ